MTLIVYDYQLMRTMEHYVVLQEELPSEDPETGRDGGSTAETSDSASQSGGATLADYRGWVEELLAMDTCMLELAGSKFSARKGRQKAKVTSLLGSSFEGVLSCTKFEDGYLEA
jgi:hypothetical protein